ncbi:hypothetical protein ACFTAO_42875 [Paenibacillus rhizoplanae]
MSPLELVKKIESAQYLNAEAFFHQIADFINNTTGEQTLELYEFIKKQN